MSVFPKSEFVHSDSWIYLSIAYNQKTSGVSLDELIGTADGINHAIPTIEEIEGAINRFLMYGILEINNNLFFLTDLISSEYEIIKKQTNSCLKQWELFNKFFQNIKLKQKPFIRYELKPDDFKRAYETYHKQFWQTYQDIKEKEKQKE
jgi:hypothetical protein